MFRRKPDEGVKRSYAWLGVIMLMFVATFWAGYSAIGMMASG